MPTNKAEVLAGAIKRHKALPGDVELLIPCEGDISPRHRPAVMDNKDRVLVQPTPPVKLPAPVLKSFDALTSIYKSEVKEQAVEKAKENKQEVLFERNSAAAVDLQALPWGRSVTRVIKDIETTIKYRVFVLSNYFEIRTDSDVYCDFRIVKHERPDEYPRRDTVIECYKNNKLIFAKEYKIDHVAAANAAPVFIVRAMSNQFPADFDVWTRKQKGLPKELPSLHSTISRETEKQKDTILPTPPTRTLPPAPPATAIKIIPPTMTAVVKTEVPVANFETNEPSKHIPQPEPQLEPIESKNNISVTPDNPHYMKPKTDNEHIKNDYNQRRIDALHVLLDNERARNDVNITRMLDLMDELQKERLLRLEAENKVTLLKQNVTAFLSTL